MKFATEKLAGKSVDELRGVGPKTSLKLSSLGINSISDLLFHFPMRYQDKTKITPIVALIDSQEALIEGAIKLSNVVYRGRRALIIKLQDDSGVATIRFFNFNSAQQKSLVAGKFLRCFGQVRKTVSGPELFHPEYRVMHSLGEATEERLSPIYPSTEGIGQNQWRNLCRQALALLKQNPPVDLLAHVSDEFNFDLYESLEFLHMPPRDVFQKDLLEGKHPAQQRLALEELVAHHLSLRKIRDEFQETPAPILKEKPEKIIAFKESLPFQLTSAQERAIKDITSDLSKNRPMLRLVQGDVGSGKTLVAAIAALHAATNGFQVAIMAPTEILAEQHKHSFIQWLEPLGIKVSLLTGRVKGAQRSAILKEIAQNGAKVVIGTHALFQKRVSFANLGLVIVDEQHRFGVHQRLALTEKASNFRAHQLVMTATPIPRTLSMLAYAELDCSIIDELPPGRKEIQTVLIESVRRDKVISRVEAACKSQRQAYWVCTLIEESDVLTAEAAEKTAELLHNTLPKIAVGLIHGRLSQSEKSRVMSLFSDGKIDLLVSTTVIEVGVDVPNASLMIIENPERLGLAQLHQLRGRIGRGAIKSHCVLLYKQPLSLESKNRLEVIRDSTDGFYIAEKDLEFRGPGEVLGTKQTGSMAFRVTRFPQHYFLLDKVEMLANRIQTDTPQAVEPLIKRWIGGAKEFGTV